MSKISWKKFIKGITTLIGVFAALNYIGRREKIKQNIDRGNEYLSDNHPKFYQSAGWYESKIKPMFDKVLSFAGLILLAPLYGIISLAIFLDDPGPVLFTQKRVGKEKRFFLLHKFRSMKMEAPHDVPTHLLSDPEQYITRVGKILRKTSLDELPQIWDIFVGNMSIIGPRPALWNQEDLVAERDKYGANHVKPGLTGWAQIHGRDELEIAEKAKMDGKYVTRLHEGGWKAFWGDVRCFFGTIYSVLVSDGIVEGGAGALKKETFADSNDVDTIPTKSKRILITGTDSYIGDSVKKYLEKEPEHYVVNTISTIGLKPEPDLFVNYDVVFNVAGIAHIKETNENRRLYFEVNRDLVIAIAKSAKMAGVAQFILLSSMSVYGISTGRIEKDTLPFPTSAYGESKLSADERIEQIADEDFKVAILRPPMVYGNGCKGNYQMLRNFALKSPVFPTYENQRSMVYIGNLCEFIKRTIDREVSGLFFPQNYDYVNTSEMVRMIADCNGKKMRFTRLFNPVINLLPLNILKKVFGDLIYEKVDTVGKYSFEESIKETERG